MAKKNRNKQSSSRLGRSQKQVSLSSLSRGNQKQREQTLPNRRISKDELATWKLRFQKTISEANSKIQELEAQGLTTLELERFRKGDEYKYFDISDISHSGKLREYMTQVRSFLASVGTNNNNAFLETALMSAQEYAGQFGSQYPEFRYNIHDVVDEEGKIIHSAINPEIASRAFENYRKLEETYAAVIGRQGQEGVFGSENLVIAIYDIEARGMEGYTYGKDLLETFLAQQELERKAIYDPMLTAEQLFADWDEFLLDRGY